MGLPVQIFLNVFMAGQSVMGSAVSLNYKNELYFPDNYFYGFPHYCCRSSFVHLFLSRIEQELILKQRKFVFCLAFIRNSCNSRNATRLPKVPYKSPSVYEKRYFRRV